MLVRPLNIICVLVRLLVHSVSHGVTIKSVGSGGLAASPPALTSIVYTNCLIWPEESLQLIVAVRTVFGFAWWWWWWWGVLVRPSDIICVLVYLFVRSCGRPSDSARGGYVPCYSMVVRAVVPRLTIKQASHIPSHYEFPRQCLTLYCPSVGEHRELAVSQEFKPIKADHGPHVSQ